MSPLNICILILLAPDQHQLQNLSLLFSETLNTKTDCQAVPNYMAALLLNYRIISLNLETPFPAFV